MVVFLKIALCSRVSWTSELPSPTVHMIEILECTKIKINKEYFDLIDNSVHIYVQDTLKYPVAIIVIIIIIIITIIMFMKSLASFLFLNPQDEVGISISSSVVLCSFVLLVDIVVFVLVFYLCPSSVRVVATFPGTVLFPLLCYVLPFSP